MPPPSYTSISTLFTIALITSLLVELVSAVKIILLIHYLTNAYIVIGHFHQLMTCSPSTSTEAVPPRERALLCLLFQVSPCLPSYDTSSQANYPHHCPGAREGPGGRHTLHLVPQLFPHLPQPGPRQRRASQLKLQRRKMGKAPRPCQHLPRCCCHHRRCSESCTA